MHRPPTLTSKQVLGISGLVVCLMIGSVFAVPWLFADPYVTSDYHRITHESAEQFDIENESSTVDPTPIEELSPPAQAVVEQGITEYQNSDPESVSYNAASYNVKYCQEEMPVCDEIERPDEFTYSVTTESDLYDVIETDDGLYRLKTHDGTYGADGTFFMQTDVTKGLSIFLILMPVAGVLAFITVIGVANQFTASPKRGGTLPQKVILGLAMYGIILTVIGIVDPFLKMFYEFSFSQNFLGVGILLTWGILFIIGIWWTLVELH